MKRNTSGKICCCDSKSFITKALAEEPLLIHGDCLQARDFVDLDLDHLKSLCSNSCVLIDVKGIYNKEKASKRGFNYWRL